MRLIIRERNSTTWNLKYETNKIQKISQQITYKTWKTSESYTIWECIVFKWESLVGLELKENWMETSKRASGTSYVDNRKALKLLKHVFDGWHNQNKRDMRMSISRKQKKGKKCKRGVGLKVENSTRKQDITGTCIKNGSKWFGKRFVHIIFLYISLSLFFFQSIHLRTGMSNKKRKLREEPKIVTWLL